MAPVDYISTEILVQGSALVATTLLAGLMGFSFVTRSISRLFAAASGRS
jgi:hypothetical protein